MAGGRALRFEGYAGAAPLRQRAALTLLHAEAAFRDYLSRLLASATPAAFRFEMPPLTSAAAGRCRCPAAEPVKSCLWPPAGPAAAAHRRHDAGDEP